MAASSRTLLDTAVSALQFPDDALARIVVQGSGALPSAFPVTDFAVEAIAAAGLGIRELLALSGVIRGDGVRAAMERLRAVQVFPLPLDLDVRFVHTPALADRALATAKGFLQYRQQLDRPAVHGRVID
jgi:hypothetical protein